MMKIRIAKFRSPGIWFGVIKEKTIYFTDKSGVLEDRYYWIQIIPFLPLMISFKRTIPVWEKIRWPLHKAPLILRLFSRKKKT